MNRSQGTFIALKKMVYLRFRAGVNEWVRKHSHTILTKELADRHPGVRSHMVRVISEVAFDKRPLSEAQEIWLGTMAEVWLEEGFT